MGHFPPHYTVGVVHLHDHHPNEHSGGLRDRCAPGSLSLRGGFPSNVLLLHSVSGRQLGEEDIGAE